MNTSAKGAAYERRYRRHYASLHDDHRTKTYWYPPRPRAHSTGRWDSIRWAIGIDDEGLPTYRTEPVLVEFKSGRTSCALAERYVARIDAIRPSFTLPVVVHRTKEREFCEH